MTFEEMAKQKAEELKASKENQEKKDDTEKKETLQVEETPKSEEVKEEKKEEIKEEKVEDKKPEPEAVKKRKDEIQSEIDRLISQKKALEAELKDTVSVVDELKELKIKAEEIKRQQRDIVRKEAPKVEDLAEEFADKNSKKYLEEDKELPREKRREMSKEELDEWIIEDMSSAIAWQNRRDYRREKEKDIFINRSMRTRQFDELREKQQPHVDNLLKEFPELNVVKRTNELKLEGRDDQEIEAVLLKENETYRLLQEVTKSNPGKYLFSENGPALVAEELRKRVKKEEKKEEVKSKREITEEEEERIRQEAAELERQRLANIDAGITSTTDEKKETKKELTEFEKRLQRVMARAGISNERYKAQVKRRKDMGIDELQPDFR